ncbi:unnamed protein product [Acanthoscelides obtectus]|uniref:HTH psq-type domain-containing protein n=1 Tax=Acanthoscelides obtectus TaxID=200917 RepID=A0A9P0L591_ACAOB|nr:unnamed protein product [Acanthoscelides obtectus]CAK1650472.1 hypothetical protein AOBTE_LOCUS16783 [Acanthoscelides obtectus]
MPNIYKRKSLERAKWTEEQLKSAMSTVKDEGLSVHQAGKTYGIPRKTLERKLVKFGCIHFSPEIHKYQLEKQKVCCWRGAQQCLER